jgi:hypothetical protein
MPKKPTKTRRMKEAATVRAARSQLIQSVTLLVGTNDDDPDEDSDWEILAVRQASVEATPRLVQENMHDVDYEALGVAAANAKDVQ